MNSAEFCKCFQAFIKSETLCQSRQPFREQGKESFRRVVDG